jgi:hypothetical protein
VHKANAAQGARLGQTRLLVILEVHEYIPVRASECEGLNTPHSHALIPVDVSELVHRLVHVGRINLGSTVSAALQE